MQIELTTPACLFLGLTRLGGELCQLGITLQYPPVQLLARPATDLTITGGRADLAHEQAARFFQHYQVAPQAEVEIELAIPSFMGLGSGAMLGLSMAQALATIHTITPGSAEELVRAVGLTTEEALERHAFVGGGLVAVSKSGALLKRQPIAHTSEDDDWVFVLVLPRLPAGIPEALEAERRRALFAAAKHLDAQAESAAETLWLAIERDDIVTFASALAELQEVNYAALARAGMPLELDDDETAILDVMRAGGALMCGRSLLGFMLYGLIRGAGPSRTLRRTLSDHLGFFGGTVMASVSDNNGAQFVSTDSSGRL